MGLVTRELWKLTAGDPLLISFCQGKGLSPSLSLQGLMILFVGSVGSLCLLGRAAMRRHSGKSATQLLIKSHVSQGWGDKLLHLLPETSVE